MEMSVDEFYLWIAYFEIQKEEKDRQERLERARK